MKKFFLLCGLDRSGNTLLSSILNQNTDICVTPNSFLCALMNNIKKTQDNVEYELCSDDTSIDNVLKNAFHNFYDNNP